MCNDISENLTRGKHAHSFASKLCNVNIDLICGHICHYWPYSASILSNISVLQDVQNLVYGCRCVHLSTIASILKPHKNILFNMCWPPIWPSRPFEGLQSSSWIKGVCVWGGGHGTYLHWIFVIILILIISPSKIQTALLQVLLCHKIARDIEIFIRIFATNMNILHPGQKWYLFG